MKNLLMYLYHDKSLITPELYEVFKFTSQRYLPDKLLLLLKGQQTSSENRLKVPCRIVWGQHDALLPPEKAREVAARFYAAELSILADCGHAPHEEKPEAVNALVLSFLGQDAVAGQVARPPVIAG
jgi:pimeloyl-ACP methyl ester carboxylesterase